MKVSLHLIVNSSNQLNVDFSFLWGTASQQTVTSCLLSPSTLIFFTSPLPCPLNVATMLTSCLAPGTGIKKPAKKSFRVLAGRYGKFKRLFTTSVNYILICTYKQGNEEATTFGTVCELLIFTSAWTPVHAWHCLQSQIPAFRNNLWPTLQAPSDLKKFWLENDQPHVGRQLADILVYHNLWQ